MTDYDSVEHLTFNTQMKLVLPLELETAVKNKFFVSEPFY